MVEALIVALMLFQIGGGLTLLHEKIGRRADFFDAVQTATGVYLAIYIAAHMSAVFLLGRWFLGMDTGTSYVFSSQGYLADPFSVRFITHYGLGAFAVIAHAGCGLRGILLAHGTKPQVANGVFAWTATTGAAVGTVIALALCAVRI